MKTSEIRRALLRRWPITIIVIVVAIAAAVLMHGKLNTVPTGQATAQMLVDTPSSSLVNVNVNSAGLTSQASVLAQALTSEAVLQDIAKLAHVPAADISAQGPFNGAGETLDVPTPSEARSMQVGAIGAPYHLAFVAQQNVPIITVTVKGPNPQAAGRVANQIVPAAQEWLSTVAATSTLPKRKQLELRQLGDAQSGTVNSKTAILIAAVLAVAIMIIGLLALVLVDRRIRDRRELKARRRSELGDLERALQGDERRSRPAPQRLSAASGNPFDDLDPADLGDPIDDDATDGDARPGRDAGQDDGKQDAPQRDGEYTRQLVSASGKNGRRPAKKNGPRR